MIGKVKCENPTNNPKCKEIVSNKTKSGLCRSCCRVNKPTWNKGLSVSTDERVASNVKAMNSYNKDNMGKSYKCIHGQTKAEAIKLKQSINNPMNGSNWDDYFGVEDARIRKQNLSEVTHLRELNESIKGKSIEYRLGEEKGSHYRESCRNRRCDEIKLKGGGANYNTKACFVLEEHARMSGSFIQHAMNGGEVRVAGYYVDGYDKVNNIVYEYDEKHHYKNGKLRARCVTRQGNIENIMKCKFIRIKE